MEKRLGLAKHSLDEKKDEMKDIIKVFAPHSIGRFRVGGDHQVAPRANSDGHPECFGPLLDAYESRYVCMLAFQPI